MRKLTIEEITDRLSKLNLKPIICNPVGQSSTIQCFCGTIFHARLADILYSGGTISCGCFRRQSVSKRRRKKLVGFKQEIGRLTVIEYSHIGKFGHTYWKCLCECGRTTVIPQYRITGERSKSCGNCKLLRNGVNTSFVALKLHKMIIDYGYRTCNKMHNFKVDKYWIDIPVIVDGYKIAIEYDSAMYHNSKENQKRDMEKIKALLNNNWKVLTIRSNAKIPNINTINKSITNLINGKDHELITLSDWHIKENS